MTLRENLCAALDGKCPAPYMHTVREKTPEIECVVEPVAWRETIPVVLETLMQIGCAA